MRTVGIIQPSYIPWRGFFDLIYEVDTFVFLDDVQYTPRDWRSRNRIKLANGETQWMTVPVLGGRNQLIYDVKIDVSQKWAKKHLQMLRHTYNNTPFFEEFLPDLEEFYAPGRFEYLSKLNIAFTLKISEWLGLKKEFVIASDLKDQCNKEEKLINIVKKLQGTTYLSGPAAKDYIIPENWSDAKIKLMYKDYSGYPEYSQISKPFSQHVTVLDLLFMVGPDASDYIWGEHRNK